MSRLRISIILIICIMLMSGCGSILPFTKQKEPEQFSNLSPDSVLMDANEIRTQTISLIQNAKKSIFIELSSLDDQEIINLLVNQSHSGLEVRILLDQWQRENLATVKSLKNQNISVQYYPAQKGQYHRVRYIVADYQTAIFYGQDWTKKGFEAHGLAVKLTDKTAWTFAKSFDKDWSYTTTLSLNLPEEIELPEDYITFTVNTGVKQQVLKSIDSATTEINAIVEQLSDPETVEALIAAKNRGCQIKLIVSPSCAVATPNTIKKFQDNQIEVRYFNHPNKLLMGFNIGIFDSKSFLMTSSSWTYYSFVINHEGALSVPSPTAVEKMKSIFAQEWANSTPADK